MVRFRIDAEDNTIKVDKDYIVTVKERDPAQAAHSQSKMEIPLSDSQTNAPAKKKKLQVFPIVGVLFEVCVVLIPIILHSAGLITQDELTQLFPVIVAVLLLMAVLIAISTLRGRNK